MTLYTRQQEIHRCKEQTFGLCGRRQGWDDLREWHWNMYIILCETDSQSRFNAWDRAFRDGALGWPRGMGWGGRWERGSGWGTHVHPWLIHVNVWQKQLQYCKVISLQLKKKKNTAVTVQDAFVTWGLVATLRAHYGHLASRAPVTFPKDQLAPCKMLTRDKDTSRTKKCEGCLSFS